MVSVSVGPPCEKQYFFHRGSPYMPALALLRNRAYSYLLHFFSITESVFYNEVCNFPGDYTIAMLESSEPMFGGCEFKE